MTHDAIEASLPADPQSLRRLAEQDPQSLRRLAEQIAAEAGALIREHARHARTGVDTKSTGTDMVTATDKASEALIVTRILEARPYDGILGEEGTDRPSTSGVRWIIDPLDGTTNFLYDYPGYNVSIAVAIDDIVVAGAVYDVRHDELFSASVGGGATRNTKPISCGSPSSVAHSLVATGFGYQPARRRQQAAVVANIIGDVRDIRRGGAAATDLCAVACGRVDAYYERGLGPWDFAAGSLIAREAGAMVGTINGQPVTGDFVLAAAPEIFEELRQMLALYQADGVV